MLKSIVRRTVGLLGLAALSGCTTAVPTANVAKPALWQLSDNDTTVYIFGTIHLLPAGYQWRTAKLDKALAESQGLVVETIVDEKNPTAFAAELGRLGISPGQPPLIERVPVEKRPLLDALITRSGLPRNGLDAMETWAAAFLLLGAQFQQLGLSGDEGVETVLREQFASSGKPIDQLESNSDQLGIFDSLPEKDQRAFLEGVIEDPSAMKKQFNRMLDAWVRGDIDGIAKSFNEDLSSSPQMREALIRGRNARWRDWAERRLATPGTVMMAVGAGHLAGEDSLISMLERGGLQVRRIQ